MSKKVMMSYFHSLYGDTRDAGSLDKGQVKSCASRQEELKVKGNRTSTFSHNFIHTNSRMSTGNKMKGSKLLP